MYEYKAVITNVVDGDTVDATISLGFNTYTKQRLRLNSVDTPEKFGKEREEGLKVKAYVEARLLNKEVKVKTLSKGSFGR